MIDFSFEKHKNFPLNPIVAAECRQWKLTFLLQLVERKNQLGVMRTVNVSAIFLFLSEK
jgi:hypothetical protein